MKTFIEIVFAVIAVTIGFFIIEIVKSYVYSGKSLFFEVVNSSIRDLFDGLYLKIHSKALRKKDIKENKEWRKKDDEKNKEKIKKDDKEIMEWRKNNDEENITIRDSHKTKKKYYYSHFYRRPIWIRKKRNK